jgi:hypothetical protein
MDQNYSPLVLFAGELMDTLGIDATAEELDLMINE